MRDIEGAKWMCSIEQKEYRSTCFQNDFTREFYNPKFQYLNGGKINVVLVRVEILKLELV